MRIPTKRALSASVVLTVGVIGLMVALFSVLLTQSQHVSAAPPPTTMNFQGRLANSSNILVADGLYNMQFRIFTVASGGSAVWTETRETTNRVQVTNGLFSVQLGSVTPLSASVFNATDLYFEITMATPATATCSTASCASWESPMTPRNKLATSAYAYNAATLNGFDETDFAAASGSTSYIQNGTSPQTADFNIIGTGTAATLQAATFDRATAGTLTIGGTNATSISLADDVVVAAGESLTITGGNTASRPASPTEGMVYYDTDTKQLLTYANGKWQADRSDAILVAANNSSARDKAAADYVADGTGDQTEINDALTAASGKKVVLLAGTYTANATILVPNDTTFSGVGKGTLIQLADIDTTDNLIENSDTSTGTGVIIRDMKLDGQRSLNTAGTQNAIRFNGLGDATAARVGGKVENVVIANFRTVGVQVTGTSDNSIIHDNYISNTAYGVETLFGSINNDISHNTAEGGTYGFFIGGSNEILQSNLAEGNSNDGIRISGAESTTVTENSSMSNGGDGIEVTGSEDVNLNSNTFENNTWLGSYITWSNNFRTTGNKFEGNTDGGILLQSSNTGLVSGNRVKDNGGTTTNQGIEIQTSDSNSITSNSISDASCSTNCYAIDISNSTSDNNYLADNTLGSGIIRDLGTGTIYANQIDANGKLINRSSDGLQIQSAAGVNLLNVDSSDNRLTVGAADSTGVILVLDTKDTTGDPTGVDGAMYYNSFDDKFRCYQNGGWTDCIGTGGGGATTALDNLSGVDINAALNATGNNLTLQTTTSGNVVLNAAGTIELQSDTNITGDVTLAAGNSLTITGGATRPSSPTEGMVFYDTATKQLLTYTGSKWQTNQNTESFIVAASNSSQAIKDSANYVADGTADQSEINSAITAANTAGGGTVYLAEGTYTVDGSVLVQSNVTLQGAGNSTVITTPNAHNSSIYVISESTNPTNISIRDLHIDVNASNQTSGAPKGIYLNGTGSGSGDSAVKTGEITGVSVSDLRNGSSGLEVSNVKHLNVTRLSVIDGSSGARGFYAVGSSENVSVESSHFSGVDNEAISLNGVNNIRIANNTIRETGVDSGSAQVYLWDADNVVISGNTIKGTARAIIVGSGSSSVTVSGNSIDGAERAVSLDTSSDTVVTGNAISNSATFGLYVSNTDRVSISNNTINASGGGGMYFPNLASTEFKITGNTITNNGAEGIYIWTGSARGIISDNVISDNAGDGLALVGVNDTQVMDNYMYNNGGSTTNDGIYLSGSDRNSIVNNRILDTSCTTNCYAINISNSTSDNNYLSGNVFSTTSGTATLRDLGTGTRYANQSVTQDGLDSLHKQSNSTQAFQIQNASGVAQLTANTTDSQIALGSSTNLGAAFIRTLADSSTGLQIQNAAGTTTIMTVDSSANTIVIGTGANTITLGANGVVLAGTARSDATISLSPEYSGATFTGDGTNNTGSLSSDFCSGSSRQNINPMAPGSNPCAATETHNYYQWTTTETTVQDYDIYVRYQMPRDYSTGSMANMQIWGWGTTSAAEIVTVSLISDASATPCSTSGNAIASNATWAQATVASPLGACTPAAGDWVTFKVRVAADENNFARAGAITFDYKRTR